LGIAHIAGKVKAAPAYSRGAPTAVAVVGASGADKDGIIKLNSYITIVGGLCVDRIRTEARLGCVSKASRRRLCRDSAVKGNVDIEG
jgi:hypothetical protein